MLAFLCHLHPQNLRSSIRNPRSQIKKAPPFPLSHFVTLCYAKKFTRHVPNRPHR
jgi:hypothetical protein